MAINRVRFIPQTKTAFTTVLLSAALLSGCGEQADKAPQQGAKKPRPHLVEVVPAKQERMAISLERSGTLRSFQDVQIFNQEEGRLISFPFHEGDKVKKGDILARLDAELLKAQLRRSTALRLKAEKDLKRIRELSSRKLAAQTELTRLETELAVAKADEALLNTRLQYTEVHSPIAGTITARLSEEGNIADQYSHLLTVSDLSTLVVELNVSELVINKLKLGMEADIMIDALSQPYQGKPDSAPTTFTGKITRIHPILDPQTRTGIVEISLSPAPAGAAPGQLARVTLHVEEEERLLIPYASLGRTQDGEFVFVVGDNNKVSAKPVITGMKFGDQQEILRGLEPGEQVVVRGFTNLEDGSTVKVVSSPLATNTNSSKSNASDNDSTNTSNSNATNSNP